MTDSLKKFTTAAAAAALTFALAKPASADCMRDSDGNYHGDCSGGYPNPDRTYGNSNPSATTTAPMPPSPVVVIVQIALNWMGLPGSIASTAWTLQDYLYPGYQYACQQQPAACLYGAP